MRLPVNTADGHTLKFQPVKPPFIRPLNQLCSSFNFQHFTPISNSSFKISKNISSFRIPEEVFGSARMMFYDVTQFIPVMRFDPSSADTASPLIGSNCHEVHDPSVTVLRQFCSHETQ